MKQFLIFISVGFWAMVYQPAFADNGPRSPWYIGFSVGTSTNAEYEAGGASYSFKDFTGSSDTFGMSFRVGGTLGAKHLLGADIGFITAAGSDSLSDYVIMMSHEVLSYTFYPATKGFFLRVGAGLGHLDRSRSSYFYGDADGTDDGTAVMFGLGYSFWIGRTFNIGLNLDHELHNYSSNSGDYANVDSASATQFAVSFDWY